jgi:2Fe-2S ferredoxin
MPLPKYKVTYIEESGKAHTVEVAQDWSLMEGAVKHLIPGIDADCGGACACATCHVYVEPEWLARLPPAQELERNMLKFALDPNERSRLSCQIAASETLDGLVVRLPERQY